MKPLRKLMIEECAELATKAYWTDSEVAHILLGFNCSIANSHISELIDGNEFIPAFRSTYDSLIRSVESGKIKFEGVKAPDEAQDATDEDLVKVIFKFSPSDVISWASESGYQVDINLAEAVNNPKDFAEKFRLINEEVKYKQVQLAKLLCQAIGKTLWDLNPKMTQAELARHSAIQVHGGGCYYEEKAIKSWLSEVDPRDPATKTGAKKKQEEQV